MARAHPVFGASPIATPVPVGSGGTGATTSAQARINLGLEIGVDVLAPNGSGVNLTGVAKLASPNTFSDTTDSTSTTTGAQIISGGVGIAKKLNVAGVVKVWDTTQATGGGAGALISLGGLYVAKKIYAEEIITVQNGSFRGVSVGGGPPGSTNGNIVVGDTDTLSQGNASTLANVAIGLDAMAWATGASSYNVCVGHGSGAAQGSFSGSHITTPNNCVWVGANIYSGSTTPSYEIVIGTDALGRGSYTTTIGTLGQTTSAQVYGTGLNRGYIFGLKLSNNGSDATNDIDIAAGEARDSTGVITISLGASITKRLDAAWSVGTGNGGLDTGSIANTTYHVWLIMRSDTGVVDALFSTSASSPTMPANYDYKRRIGSIVRAGATILAFTQDGDRFTLTTPVQDVSVTNLTTSRTTYTLASVPTGLRLLARIRWFGSNASGGTLINVNDLNETDAAPSATVSPGFMVNVPAAGVGVGHVDEVLTNTSAQIGARSTAASTTFRVETLGWIDRRGKDA